MATTHATSNIPAIQLHHRLAIALEWAGVKRSEMAEMLGISANTMSNYTNGRTTPSLSVVRVWALATGVPFEWLMHGTDPQNDPDRGREQGVSASACNGDATVFKFKLPSRFTIPCQVAA